jgi:hypothetical protein
MIISCFGQCYYFSIVCLQKSFEYVGISRFSEIRDRCYDHNFLRFLTIFGEKIGVFLKTTFMIKLKKALYWVKNANFFAENI